MTVAIGAEDQRAESLHTAARIDIARLHAALRLYRLDQRTLPSQLDGLRALAHGAKPYVASVPTDPWGRVYGYANPGTRGAVDVYCLGPDGVAGTADDIWPERPLSDPP